MDNRKFLQLLQERQKRALQRREAPLKWEQKLEAAASQKMKRISEDEDEDEEEEEEEASRRPPPKYKKRSSDSSDDRKGDKTSSKKHRKLTTDEEQAKRHKRRASITDSGDESSHAQKRVSRKYASSSHSDSDSDWKKKKQRKRQSKRKRQTRHRWERGSESDTCEGKHIHNTKDSVHDHPLGSEEHKKRKWHKTSHDAHHSHRHRHRHRHENLANGKMTKHSPSPSSSPDLAAEADVRHQE